MRHDFCLVVAAEEVFPLTRLFPLLLFLVPLSLFGANYADQAFRDLRAQAGRVGDHPSPETVLLWAEKAYYMSHEASQQQAIADWITSLYEKAGHQELRAELGFILSEQYRRLGEPELVEQLVGELGYVSEWNVLGPLAPDRNLNLRRHLKDREVKGLSRPVRPILLRAYGDPDYWGHGIGQYGFFSADQAIFPNQLAGALFSTWFYASEKGAYRFGLGWSHIAKAWINRTVVFEGREKQDIHPDQAVVHFSLKKGWHRLSLYTESGSEDPVLGFFARLTTAAGKPLEFRADRSNALPKKKATILSGMEASLVELAAARSQYSLASVLLAKEQLDHSRYENPKDLLEQAFAAAPDRDIVEKLLSLTRDPNERWRYTTKFLERLPQNGERSLERAWALTQLGQIALDQGRYWEARQYATRATAIHEDFWPARVLENNTFSSLGLEGQALRHTVELDQRYSGVPWIMMDLCDLYWAMDYHQRAEPLVDRILAIRSGNIKFSERKIRLLKDRGDLEALDAFYRSLLRDTPYSEAMRQSYAQFLTANRKYEQAAALLREALDQLPENPYLLESMGELKLTMGDADALDYLKQALALRPQNPSLEKLIMLSEAEREAFYAPYRIAETPKIPILEVSGIAVNFDNTVRKVASNGQSSVFHQLEYEILSEGGAQELPGYSFSYAPLRQKSEVIKAELYRGDGTILLTKHGRSRISDPAYRMYYDLVAYRIAFPTLEVGDRIRIEYRIDDIDSQNIFGDYFGELHYFADEHPIRLISYTLIVPKEREIHYHVEKMKPHFEQEFVDDQHVLSWSMERVAAYEVESRMPGLVGYLPYLGVSTFNDWQHMARWYAKLIENQLKLDRETKKIVAGLTEGVEDRLEIVKRIHEFVITHTRYVALEFGIHGYKPYEVNQVCTRQFGDCKDKASLIVAMLRDAGIEADIAIVRTADEGDVHPFPAMLSYFNHAIAYVPEFDLFLDGTAEFSGINELPAMDQGALTLIVDKRGRGRLTKIPIQGENLQGYNLELSVSEDGGTRVKGEVSYQGVVTPELRQYLSIESKLTTNLQNLLSGMVPGLDVEEAQREGMRINDPITLRFKGFSKRLVQAGKGRMKLPLKILSNELTRAYTPNAKRKFPLDFGVPKTRSVQVRVAMPPGYVLDEVPQPLDVEDKNFAVRIRIDRFGPEQCLINYRVTFKSPRVSPAEYASLRSMLQAHDRLLDQSLLFVAR